MKRKITIILVIGILIRLFLAFSTFHPDLQVFYYAGEVIAKGNILNFYDYLRNLPPGDPILTIYPTNLFIYPPLFYFFFGPVSHLLSSPFSYNILHNFIFGLSMVLGNLQLNLFLLAIKLPYLAFDLGIAFLLFRLFEKPKNKLLAFTLWIFNPINLYATYMMGQFDVIPTFLTVLALFLAVKKEKYFYSALFLGLGASFKIFPVLLLVPLALVRKKWIERLIIIAIGAGTYILGILPFFNSVGFRSSAFVAGQTTKSLYATLPISGGEAIIYFPLFILFLYMVFYYSKLGLERLWERFFVILLMFFIFTHIHPQWFTWLTPFLVIDLVKSGLKHWPLVLILLLAWFGQLTFFDPSLTTRIFSPINPSLIKAPGVWEGLGIGLDVNSSRSILQTLFVASGLYYIYFYFAKERKI